MHEDKPLFLQFSSMEAGDHDLRSFVTASPSLEMNDIGDSTAVYPNHSHPKPFIENHRFDNPTTTQNHTAQEDLFSPMNLQLHPYQIQTYDGCGCGWLNPIPDETSPRGIEDLASSMGRLCLSNPYSDTAVVTNGNGVGRGTHNFFFMDPAGYDNKMTLLCNPNRSDFSTLAHHHHHHLHYEYGLKLKLNGERFLWSPPSPQHHNFSSLEEVEDVRGQVVSLAQDQRGCRFLKNKLDEGRKPEVIEMILWEVKDHLCELMMHQFGNYLIQNIFEASSVDQMTRILALVFRDEHKLKQVCIHNHGSRAIQKLLEHLKTPEQISTAIFALKRITLVLTKSVNGGYVIQQTLKLFSPALTKFVLDEVAKNCVEIATDRSGCSILQKCLDHAKGEAMRLLIEEIVSYALVLAANPYGNYVVQYVVKMKIPQINAAIISQLLGKYGQLSMNKHASNVVEDLLEFSEESDAAIIIQEIMYNRDFLGILQNPYGNYVAQRALKNSKGALHKMLSNSILSNYTHLHSHLYGKRVLAFAKGCKIRV